MIKRMTALALAALMLLAALTACAESNGAMLKFSKPKLTLIGEEGKNTMRLYNISLNLAVGSTEGVPTLQATLDYGEQIDFVAQIVDNRLLMSAGGVYGNFYVDLTEVLEDEGKGQLMAAAVGAGLVMFAGNPEMVLNLWMPLNSKNQHRLDLKIPKKSYRAVADRVLGMMESASPDLDTAALRDWVYSSSRSAKVRVVYDPKSEKFSFRITRGHERFQLDARLKLTTEPLELINISAEEEQFDLLHLDDLMRESLSADLDFMSMKTQRFITGVHLDELTGEGETEQE